MRKGLIIRIGIIILIVFVGVFCLKFIVAFRLTKSIDGVSNPSFNLGKSYGISNEGSLFWKRGVHSYSTIVIDKIDTLGYNNNYIYIASDSKYLVVIRSEQGPLIKRFKNRKEIRNHMEKSQYQDVKNINRIPSWK